MWSTKGSVWQKMYKTYLFKTYIREKLKTQISGEINCPWSESSVEDVNPSQVNH